MADGKAKGDLERRDESDSSACSGEPEDELDSVCGPRARAAFNATAAGLALVAFAAAVLMVVAMYA